jgi:hypothetical protein
MDFKIHRYLFFETLGRFFYSVILTDFQSYKMSIFPLELWPLTRYDSTDILAFNLGRFARR